MPHFQLMPSLSFQESDASFYLYLAIPAFLYIQQMAAAIFASFLLVILHIPLMEGYRDGARQESCYNMLAEHENSFAPPEFRIVPPTSVSESLCLQYDSNSTSG